MRTNTNYPKVNLSPETMASMKEQLIKYGGIHLEGFMSIHIDSMTRTNPKTKNKMDCHRVYVKMMPKFKREIRLIEGTI